MPLGYQGVNVELMSIPRLIYLRVQNLVPIGPAVWHLSHIVLMCDLSNPLQMPLVAREVDFILADVHSQINLYSCAKCGPDRTSGLEAFAELLIDDPPNPHAPPGILYCLARYSAAPPFAGCQMTANGVSRRG